MHKLKEEIKVILIYLIIGLSWIYFSDKILLLFVADSSQVNQLQTYKGIFYVISTALIFYFLFKKYLDNLRSQKIKLKDNNFKLKKYNQEIKTVNQELDQSLNRLEELNQRFIKMINSVSSLNEKTKLDEEDFLSDLLLNLIEIVPEADYGKIYLIEDQQCKFIDSVGHQIEILKDIQISDQYLLDFNSDGVNFSRDFSIAVDQLPEAEKVKFMQAVKKVKESMFVDIKIKNKVVGRISLDVAAESDKTFNEGTVNILESFSTLASSFFAYKRFDKLQGKFTKELISSIIKILEMYDVYTKGHSENVANLSLLIAEELGLSEEKALDSYWAGMVHDIGKLLVPVQILNKKSKLEDYEYELIKKHPGWSSKALSNSETLEHIVLYHHERWDGRGYPEGLKADQIPLVSQIIAVADAWDAMTSDRSYRNSLSKEEALKEIRENKGTQFSPRAAEAFLRVMETKELDIKSDVRAKFEALESEEFKLDKSQYFESLFKKSNEGIVILDQNFKIKKVNEYFVKLFGFKESEILGRKIRDVLIPAEKLDEVQTNINHLIAKQEVNAQTYRKKKDGKRIDVEVQAFSLNLKGDEVEYYVIYRDISELEAAKSKYENYKGRYEALFENESTVMLIIDPDSGKIIDANPAAVNFYGWSKERLKSMKISEINVLTEKELKEEMKSARRKNKKHFNFIHQTKRGELMEVEVYSQPINFGSKDFLYSIVHEKKKVRV
ncbi:PAS domain S-box-containing protein [Halanaerobium saccharolyticum]|uniref:PAS domain S-box-containing protein n=1 Tax=Halanaerobium saccharolyticum TaxID=43595 RepID=A0A4R6LJW1_9FIRM|nr:HD domain-containing phosphohydrolase [Halanaerobium saccharolyticum]TDO84361.1 PAS domain S-box-containing protein [Halanaerobium saccharolyticum]